MHADASSGLPETDDRSFRDSTRPIRALNRGLDVLTELNRLERAAINTLANAVDLPRTTTYRILETLRLAGYVERDPHDDCYRPTIMVRALSDGFDDEAMLAHVARPHLAALCTQIVWPVAIATPAGSAMMIREATDYQSPLALEHYGAGVRVPMLGSAAGRAYLAYCAAPQREALIELLARSPLPEDRLARNRQEVERILAETRAQGYGISQRAPGLGGNESCDSLAPEGPHHCLDNGPLCGDGRRAAYRRRPVSAENAGNRGENRTRGGLTHPRRIIDPAGA